MFAVADVDKRRDGAAQVEQRVQLDGGFGALEMGPREQCQAQIDGRAVQGIDGVLELDAEVLLRIQSASGVNQRLGEVGVDAPVAHLIGIGERVTGDGGAKAHVIELVLLRAQADFDVT